MTKDAILEIFMWCSSGTATGFAGALIIDIIRYLMG